MLTINVHGNKKQYPKQTSLIEIAKDFQHKERYDIVLAIVNDQLSELHKQIKIDSDVRFLTTKHKNGILTYRRSVPLLMLKAFSEVVGCGIEEKVVIKYSLSKGSYCEYSGEHILNQELLDKVKEKMRELVEKDLPIIKRSINTEQGLRIFKERGMYDKEKLFKYRRSSRMNIYELDGYIDYYFSYLVPSTRYLRYFDLFLYDKGFVLQLPVVDNPELIPKFEPQHKLFNVFNESNDWSKMMEIYSVGTLNEQITKGEINDMILVQEALQEKKIADIANTIKNMRDKKFVMVAGPSSSGKTTFAHRLAIQLRASGLKPHLISADDYFLNRVNSPRDENGEYNYEVIEAIDLEQFNKDLVSLDKGEVVQMPHYNFLTGEREYKGKYLQLCKDDILVVEGIHCLNDRFSHAIDNSEKFKIYISALTQLNIDEHNRISTTDGRLLRRIVRDAHARGVDAQGTIARWQSVRNGEESNIFPYQEQADVMFNSALIYELAVLKQYAEPFLFNVPRESEEYLESKRLLKFLDFFVGINGELIVPKNSILREFIGGTCF